MRLDGGVVFDKDVRTFFKDHLTDTVPVLPQSFTLSIFNPATFKGRGGT
jgi:hypothetical protein